MDKDLVKTAYKEAENSLKEKQVEEVKRIVLKTLEKIETLKTEKEKSQANIKELDEKIKCLRMDIDDLKEGRLDRIEERQEKDAKAKETSVVIIIKEKTVEHDYPYWAWPYRVTWVDPPWYTPQVTYTTTCGASSSDAINTVYLTSSSARWGTAGAYAVGNSVVNLR